MQEIGRGNKTAPKQMAKHLDAKRYRRNTIHNNWKDTKDKNTETIKGQLYQRNISWTFAMDKCCAAKTKDETISLLKRASESHALLYQ